MKKAALFGFVAALSMIGVANVDTLTPGASPASAVVYCKAYGVPRGCVARPAGSAVVAHPAPRHVVYCTRPGYPRGCVVR